MAFDTSEFKFANNIWQCVFSVPHPMTLWLKGNSDFFEDSKNLNKLELLVNGISDQIDQATNFAKSSEYTTDIADGKGLVLNSVYVDQWDDIRIWFSLLNDVKRMVGVRIVESRPVDVFCDHATY